jgi:hypothetical protein
VKIIIKIITFMLPVLLISSAQAAPQYGTESMESMGTVPFYFTISILDMS